MGETIVRDVFVALLTFSLIITAGLFILTDTLSFNNLEVDADLGDEFAAFNSTLSSFSSEFEDSVQEAPKSTKQSITDFFTRGIKMITVFLQSPTVALQAITFVSTSWGFSLIPASIWALIITIITSVVLFTVMSAYLRNKT